MMRVNFKYDNYHRDNFYINGQPDGIKKFKCSEIRLISLGLKTQEQIQAYFPADNY